LLQDPSIHRRAVADNTVKRRTSRQRSYSMARFSDRNGGAAKSINSYNGAEGSRPVSIGPPRDIAWRL
jgi:hypothetical protein